MCDPEAADSKKSAGAPEHEIEVTPAMVDAGALAFLDVDRRFDGIEVAIEKAFRAMMEMSARSDDETKTKA